MTNNAFTALKKFINAELAGPGGPTSMYAGAATSIARLCRRAPSRAFARARLCPRARSRAFARAHRRPRAPSPARVVAPVCSLPPSLPPSLPHSLPPSLSPLIRVSNVTKGSTK